MTGSDTEGPVTFTIDFNDSSLALNPGVQVTAVTDGSSVTFDKTNPSVSITTPAVDSVTTVNNVNGVFVVTDTNPGTCAYTIDAGVSTPIVCAGANIGSLTDGRRVLEVTATDAAGNSASANVSFVINLDNNLTVGAGKDFATIQAAVNAATSGDTISIDSDDYPEAVVIDGKDLTLTGVSGVATALSFTLTNTTVSGSTSVGAPVVNVNPGAKIQDGVLLALGSTVNVAAGTYTEQLVINKDLTVVGASSLTTTIQAPAVLAGDANGFKNIVTVTGAGVDLELSGFTIAGPGPSGCGSIHTGIFVRDGANANIHNNTILNIRDEPFSGCQNGVGIFVGRNAFSTTGTATITHNIIMGHQKGGIVVDNAGSSATISGNTVNGIGATPTIAENGIQISRGATGSITNNQVTGHIYTGGAGACAGDGSNAPNKATFYNNCDTSTSILLYQQGAGVIVTGNTVTNSQVGVDVSGPNGATIELNRITGSTLYGLHADVVIVDASPNWWGDATGPYHSPENTLGTGNAVSDNADYSPWCTNPGCTTFGSSDPLDHLELFLNPGTPGVPGSVTVPGSANMTVTAKDAANITRVNETALVSLSADGSATIVGGNFFPPFNSGVATADIMNSVAETVNVGVAAGGKTVIGQIIFTGVTIPDVTPPVITLLGMNPVTLTVGDTFTDPRATANDNINGDITGSIIVGGDTVDTDTADIYVVTYDVSDSALNPAVQEKRYVIVVEPDVTPVIPTVALNGTAIVSAYTVTEATTRFASGLQFDTTNAASVTVNGTSVAPAATITAATQAQTVTLGAHTYNVVVTSSTGHTANITVSYQVNADPEVQGNGTLVVTGIGMVANANGSTGFAIANDTFESGWAWIFRVTVPTDETLFAMRFTDFVNSLGSIPATNNIRFYSAQSDDAFDAASAIVIAGANVYSDDMTLATDLKADIAGRQIDVRVEVRVPVGTAGGAYSAGYGVRSEID